MSMERKPKSIMRTAVFVGVIVIGILIYAYGWQVTEIGLEEPQDLHRQQQATRALRGLLSPDLFEWDEESQIAYAHFLVPCTGESPAQPEVAEGEPTITLSPDCGEANQKITIEAANFPPNSEGYVRWTPPGRTTLSRATIRTDSDGHFLSTQLRVPTASESEEIQIIEVEVVQRAGMPRPSNALKMTFERMIETVFLALMATTVALPLAIVISFVAAYNLMRPIRTNFGGFLAALLPFPLGWAVGRLVFQPVSGLALSLGNTIWLGIPVLAVVLAALYLVVVRATALGRGWHPLLAGLVRYAKMVLTIVLLLFAGGLISGIGVQISLALSNVLGGILGNILGTLSELLGLLLPVFGGLAGAFILGSLAGTLLDTLLERINNAFVQRALGLVLGALVGGLFAYLIYRGIFNFYLPGEDAPLASAFAIGGAVLGGALGLILRADYPFPIGLVIYYTTRTILNALRSIESLIVAMIFAIWVGIGPFAGVLALTLHSVAALGKLFSEQVESIDPGPIEAITATGAGRLQTIVYGVVPQIVPTYLAFTLYRWDINVRMSTIIGFVGGGGIGMVLSQWINLLQYRQAGVAVLAIAIVVSVLDYVSAQARERIA